MTNGIHIRRKGKLWLVERGNYLLGEFKDEDDAVELGRQRAQKSRSDLLIYADDGTLERKETFPEKRHAKAS